MSIRKILVPHDGEQLSEKAMMQAVELAKALTAEIVILFVIERIEVPATLVLGNDNVLIQRAKRTITRELENRWNNFANTKLNVLKSQNIMTSFTVRKGDPAEEIVKYSKEISADLIVIGSRRLEGRSKIAIALGSVARKVSERASIPVMIVH